MNNLCFPRWFALPPILAACMFVVPAQAGFVDAVYWTDPGIVRAPINGSSSNVISVGDVEDVQLDLINGHILWTDSAGVRRANLDGSSVTDLVLGSFNTLEVFPEDDLMFFTTAASGNEQIHRARLDGSDHQLVLTAFGSIGGVTADISDGYLLWSEPVADRIVRSNLDGTSRTIIVDNIDFANNAQGLNMDAASDELYWFDITDQTIRKADVTTLNAVQDIYDINVSHPASGIRDMRVDFENEHVYWISTHLGTIDRVNFDGTDPMTVASGVFDSGRDDRGLALSFMPESSGPPFGGPPFEPPGPPFDLPGPPFDPPGPPTAIPPFEILLGPPGATVLAVPEPSTLSLAAIGLIVLFGCAHRRKRWPT